MTSLAFLCQYFVISRGTDEDRDAKRDKSEDHNAWWWLGFQATAAFIRLVYWSVGPSFDDPKTENAELVVINNSTSEFVTLKELVCSVESTDTVIPMWLYDHLTEMVPLKDIIHNAIYNTEAGLVPRGEGHLLSIDFDRILRHRVPLPRLARKETHAGYCSGEHPRVCPSPWRLAFWRDLEGGVHSVVVVNSVYHHRMVLPHPLLDLQQQDTSRSATSPKDIIEGDSDGQEFIQKQCWIHANTTHKPVDHPSESPPHDYRLEDPCTTFALTADHEVRRLHLQRSREKALCSPRCPFEQRTDDFESELTAQYLAENGPPVLEALKVIEPHIHRWDVLDHDADMLVTNTGPLFTRNGKAFNSGGQLNFGSMSLHAGILAVRKYLKCGTLSGSGTRSTRQRGGVSRVELPLAQAALQLKKLFRERRKPRMRNEKDEEDGGVKHEEDGSVKDEGLGSVKDSAFEEKV